MDAFVSCAPCGVVVFDDEFRPLLRNELCSELLGLSSAFDNLLTALLESRVVRPDLLVRHLKYALEEAAAPSFHVAEAADGSIRCLEFSVGEVQTGLHVCWVRDVTEGHQLKQYRLFAEIGRMRSEKSTTGDLAQRLVDAILEFLNVDIVVLTLRERDRLRPLASRGLMLDPGTRLDPELHPYVRKAIESRKPIVGDGSEWEQGEPAELTGVHYIVPLVSSGEVVGTLHLGSLDSVQLLQLADVERASPRFTFDTIDAAFLDALSGYAGAALANVRLFEANLEERARLQTVVESIPEGVVVYNTRGEILLANTAAHRITGLPWVNLNTDSRPYRVRDLAGQIVSRSEWPFFRAVRTGRTVVNDVFILDFGDHRRFIEFNVVPVPSRDSKAASFVGTMQDVTERVEQETRREELLSVASHELRSPLTPLTGFLQMIRRQIDRGESVDASLVGRAEHQVSRLSRLLETLLDVTRLESGRMDLNLETTDLRDVVGRIVELWRAHPRHIEFGLHLPSHPVMASVDADRVDQVLANVVDNAVKHSADGGRISVHLELQGESARIRVCDEGTGIPPHVLPHVFDRFYSKGNSSSRQSGMGLGLYITRQIVEHHEGTIAIESTEGEGTCVTIELPVDPH